MGSKWRKAKLALGFNRCVLVPRPLEDSPPSLEGSLRCCSALSGQLGIGSVGAEHADVPNFKVQKADLGEGSGDIGDGLRSVGAGN
jgi:hypothetical protein